MREATMQLLPPPEGKCPVCASEHKPTDPHNAGSIYYGMRFLMTHGRDATWADAMAHCDPSLAALWKFELEKAGCWSQPVDDQPIADPPGESFRHVVGGGKGPIVVDMQTGEEIG